MDPVPLRAKAKVFPLVCKAYIRWLLDFLDLSSSYPPLSLCSSPTDLFAVPTPCQERLHFRHLDLAVFTLKMLFSHNYLANTFKSLLKSPLQNEAYSDHPIKTATFSLPALPSPPTLLPFFLPYTKHESCTNTLYYLFNVYCLQSHPPHTHWNINTSRIKIFFKEESTKQIGKYVKLNENKTKTYQNLWEADVTYFLS